MTQNCESCKICLTLSLFVTHVNALYRGNLFFIFFEKTFHISVTNLTKQGRFHMTNNY